MKKDGCKPFLGHSAVQIPFDISLALPDGGKHALDRIWSLDFGISIKEIQVKTEKVFFESEGMKISGILHLPDQKNPPCVIASHGLLSSKDSEKYIALGEKISREGMAMLRFDFRGIGESEGSEEDNTVSKKIADLSAAIDFIRSYPGLGKRIGLLGRASEVFFP